MISKGTVHNNGSRLANYITRGKEQERERAELWQMRGFAATNLKDAFRDVHIMAGATKCENPFFHVQVRNREGEVLSRTQWETAADRIEAALGLAGQPRAIAFHINEVTGNEHMHVVFSRINQDAMTAVPLPFFKQRLKEVSRQLEREFGLQPVINERRDKIEYAPTRAEDEQARRLGTDVQSIRKTIRDCFERSDCGLSFKAALAEENLVLAQGDRRDFIVIDHHGGMQALGKRILGVSAADVRQRFQDLERDKLPTIQEARLEQLHRATERADAVVREQTAKGKEKTLEFSPPSPSRVIEKPSTSRASDFELPVQTNQNSTSTYREAAGKVSHRLGKVSLRLMEKSLDVVGDAFESLFAPPDMPERVREGNRAIRSREAEAAGSREVIKQAEEIVQKARIRDDQREAERQRDFYGGGRER